MIEIRERQVASEERLTAAERSVGELKDDIERLAKLLRGNGGTGLVAHMERVDQRIAALESQCKWILGILAALVIASLRSVVWG
jgi:hypothetical protein